MRPTSVSLSAAGYSNWIPVDYLARSFGIGFGCALSNGAALTFSVQHTFDDPGPQGSRPVTVVTAGSTTATVTDLSMPTSALPVVGDGVVIQGSGSSIIDGQWNIASIISATQYTVTLGQSSTLTSQLGTLANTLRAWPHAVVSGVSSRIDGNYAFPIQALRLYVSAYTSGSVSLTLLTPSGP